MKTKRFLKTAVALTLAVVLTCLNPLQTFASGGEKEYLSDVYVCVSDSADSAKQYLTENGYSILDTDLNEGTGSAVWNSYNVYLGYKTTTNPEEAITDLAVMDMNGDYSYADYEEVLKKKKTEITESVQSLQAAIAEYRANYGAGLPAAVSVHDLLNYLSEDDSGKLLGDFLMEASEEQLITFFMQANLHVVSTVYQQLYIACETEAYQSGVTKMSENGTWVEENNDYYDAAAALLEDLPNLQSQLDTYSARQVTVGDESVAIGDMTAEQKEVFYGGDDYQNYVDSLSEEDRISFVETGAYYELLNAAAFSDQEESLYDFFDQDASELTPESLYPLVAGMTPGQRALAPYVGLETALFSGYEEDAQKSVTEQIDSVANGATVSVYSGVDRSMFDPQGIALTKQADNWASASGDNSWYYGNIGSIADPALLITILALAGTTTALFTAGLIAFGVAGYLMPSAIGIMDVLGMTFGYSVVYACSWISGEEAALEFFAILGSDKIAYGLAMKLGYVFSAAAYVCLAALLIVSVVYLSMNVYSYFHPEYTEIPRVIVNNLSQENGNQYLYYNAVRQTVITDGKEAVKTDENGNEIPEYGYYADLNGWSGKQWNALYTTKDPNAGKPILASGLLADSTMKDTTSGVSAVHLFNNDGAYNINEHAYWDDKKGVYLYFERDAAYGASSSGSIFGATSMVLLAIGCVIGGGAIGSAVTYGLTRKKKKAVA